MCSGRVDLALLLRAFSNGIDGVFVGACRLNECNYVTNGNYYALNTVLLFKRIMEYICINPERLTIQFMSSAEANVFVESINNFVKKIKEIGPLGEGEGEHIEKQSLKEKLDRLLKLVPYIKLMKNEKLAIRLNSPHDYEGFFTKEEIRELIENAISYYIDPEKCQACMACTRKCPVDAIISAKGEIHVIDQEKCIKCGSCYDICPERFKAVTKISGAYVPTPIPAHLRRITRKERHV